jgi:hypothetical protein
MRNALAGDLLKWVFGPGAVMVLFAALGEARASDHTGTLLERTASLPDAELLKLEGLARASFANATWAFGNVDAVRRMMRTELDRIGDGPGRARVLLRLALVDDNFDGQAALIAQACVADPSTCAHPANAARLEASRRFVAPGNRLPLALLEGHPPVGR